MQDTLCVKGAITFLVLSQIMYIHGVKSRSVRNAMRGHWPQQQLRLTDLVDNLTVFFILHNH